MRDTARFFDACNGFDQRDPSQPSRRGRMGGGTRDRTTSPGERWSSSPTWARPGCATRWPTSVAAAAESAGRARRPHDRGPRWSPISRLCGANGPWPARWLLVTTGCRLSRPDRRPLAGDADGSRTPGPGALHPGAGRLHRGLPPAAERGHGRSLRGGRLRHGVDQPRRRLRRRGSSPVDHPRRRPDPRDRASPGPS